MQHDEKFRPFPVQVLENLEHEDMMYLTEEEDQPGLIPSSPSLSLTLTCTYILISQFTLATQFELGLKSVYITMHV